MDGRVFAAVGLAAVAAYCAVGLVTTPEGRLQVAYGTFGLVCLVGAARQVRAGQPRADPGE
jgi:hypothetical protein